MAVQKPSKPDVTLPNNFGGTKTPYTDSQISNGYQEAVPQVVDGGNINYEKDAVFKYLKYLKTVIDALVDMPIGKSIVIDANNRFEYISPENSANKTGTINASSTATQYPNAKAVYDAIKGFNPDLFLHRSGDEMFSGVKTGQSNNPRFGFKHTEIDVTTNPSAEKSTRIFVSDKNNKWISEIGFYQKEDGGIISQITANNDTAGVASLQIICKTDGSKYATCPTPPDAADSSTKIATTAWVNSRITSIMNNKLQVVSSLPSRPNADTFYFIPED
jgi:hypothetical protein